MSVVGQTPCGPSVCYDVDGPLVFILGRCHRSHAPPWHTAHPGFEYFFFYRCGFPFCTEPFAPCPVMLLWFAFQDTVPFLPFKHDPVTQFCQLQKGARLILKALCSNSSKKKIVMVVTYVFQTSGLKAKKKKKKNLQCFFPCFLIGGMTKQDWNLNYASPAWRHVSPSALARPGEGVLRLLSLCCMLNTHHLPPCILPPASCRLLLLLFP